MKTLIKDLCAAAGVGGVGDIADCIRRYAAKYTHEAYTDTLGSVIAVRRCGKDNAPLLLLEAHMDEIGFIVTHVDDRGFIHVSNCGGIDRRVLAAAEVTVLTEPPLNGVFCSTPPHLSHGDEKIKAIEDMGIDVGLPAETVKTCVPKGTRVMFRADFKELGAHLVCAKALDDRIGCAAVIRALELLKDEDLSCDVAALFAVQEEIGGAGASVASFALHPQAAIATDVSFATTPDSPSHKCGKLGEGPMLGIAPGLDHTMTEQLKTLAKRHEIPLQYEVMGGDTGTDADGIAYAKDGVPTALLSIPQRYMHMPVEVIDVRDADYIARLMAYMAKEGAFTC